MNDAYNAADHPKATVTSDQTATPATVLERRLLFVSISLLIAMLLLLALSGFSGGQNEVIASNLLENRCYPLLIRQAPTRILLLDFATETRRTEYFELALPYLAGTDHQPGLQQELGGLKAQYWTNPKTHQD